MTRFSIPTSNGGEPFSLKFLTGSNPDFSYLENQRAKKKMSVSQTIDYCTPAQLDLLGQASYKFLS